MTLSPVFRSQKAVRMLEDQGIWERFGPTLARQAEAVRVVCRDLAKVIGEEYRKPLDDAPFPGAVDDQGELRFMQDYFFLTLFLSLFESLGISHKRLPFYGQLNFCIMGTITAADNLFDDQEKSLLPLQLSTGPRFQSIVQLMCFERLTRRVGDRAAAEGLIAGEEHEHAMWALLNQMALIGQLEGSEEGGVDDIPTPEAMIDKVHRVRGGMLFGLAFQAPKVIENGQVLEKIKAAEPAVARLGTAFQIVDDLTDFEVDLKRRSHNLLVSHIHHKGKGDEKAALERLLQGGTPDQSMVEGVFIDSARAVLDLARLEARSSFSVLEELGFWFPARLADEVVHAIVGLEGVGRMDALTGQSGQ